MIRRLWHALFPPAVVVTVTAEPERRKLKSYADSGARVRYSPGCDGTYDQAKAVARKTEADKREVRRRLVAADARPKKAAKKVAVVHSIRRRA
jgi:hypothetical protein